MGLSSDPEARARQLAGLERGRGLHEDPERRERQLDALAEGRTKRHPPPAIVVDELEQQTPLPGPSPRRGRAVPATYEQEGVPTHAPVSRKRRRRRRKATAAAPAAAADQTFVDEAPEPGPDRLGALGTIFDF